MFILIPISLYKIGGGFSTQVVAKTITSVTLS